MSENLFLGDTTYPHTTDRQRADALAAVIHDLKKLVTADHETKEAFIDRVKNALSVDPDLRVSDLHNRIATLEAQLVEAKKLAAPQELRKIGELLRTQDNQYTADAIFLVQQSRINTGIDTGYCETNEIVWICEDCMFFEDEDYFHELEKELIETGVERENHTRTGFSKHWDFLQLFFTQAAADEFIAKHGHKHGGDLRVSVESAYRNSEFQTVRNWLLSLPATNAVKEQSDA